MDDQSLLADYLDRPTLAKKIKKTPKTLERWESQRIGPPVTRLGRKPFYNINSFRSWLKSRETPMVRERKGDA